MRGDEHEGLVRVRRVGERISGAGAGTGHIAGDVMVACPTHQPVSPTEVGSAPGNPPVVRLQPRASARGIIRVEAEVGGKAQQEQRLGEDQPAGWGRRAVS